MTYHKKTGEEANKTGKAERMVGEISKVKMQMGWKDRWKGWMAFDKPSSLGTEVPYFTAFIHLFVKRALHPS